MIHDDEGVRLVASLQVLHATLMDLRAGGKGQSQEEMSRKEDALVRKACGCLLCLAANILEDSPNG